MNDRAGAGVHTRTEISSQPETWKLSVERLQKLEDTKPIDFARYDQVIFIGCGSTQYVSQWAAYQCRVKHGIPSFGLPSSELMLSFETWAKDKRTVVVAISRSGETTETLLAVKKFLNEGNGDVYAVTCYPESELARLASNCVVLSDAQEESIAQTRSFTSMVLGAAWLIAGEIPEGLAGKLKSAGQKLIARYQDMAVSLGRDRNIDRFFFLGNGPQFGLAREATLKMKEMSLSYSGAYHFLEFRHGPMSMVNDHTLVVGLLSDENAEEALVLKDMKELGGKILAIAEKAGADITKTADYLVELKSDLSPIWRAPLYLPVLQFVAFERSLSKNLDPDHPTHLDAVVVLDK